MERVAHVMTAVGFFSLSEWSFTMCMTHKNVLRVLLNKTFPFFLGTQSRTEKCFNDEVLFAVFVRCTVCSVCTMHCLLVFVRCTVRWCLYDALFAGVCTMHCLLVFVRCTVHWCLYDALFASVYLLFVLLHFNTFVFQRTDECLQKHSPQLWT